MYEERVKKLASLLESRAKNLDISESLYLEAKKRYESVGKWLSESNSNLRQYEPTIYPQGSFRLGTVIKPLSKEEYDIDLVCYLDKLDKDETSQKELKKLVGDRLAQNSDYNRLLDKEGRRCWTLNYKNEFHMDILPSIADQEKRKKGAMFKDAILITDKKKIENGDIEWPKSDPIGYANWFFERQQTVFQEIKRYMATILKKDVEEIPNYRIKTPLQRAIQILKRHRDIYCSDKGINDKPISIIITTISALLYEGEQDVYNAIYNILFSIDIKNPFFLENGKFVLPNPVNENENFAEKWNEKPNLSTIFFEWLQNAKETFEEKLLQIKSDAETDILLNESLRSQADRNSYINPFVDTKPVYVKATNKNNKPWGLN